MNVSGAMPPWLGRWVADDGEAHTALWRLRGATLGHNLFIGCLRGWKMRERSGVFEQFAALLQFPRYFGGNWNAFSDCIKDLDWLRANGFLLVLLDATEVLAEGDPDELGLLLTLLDDTAASFAHANEFRPVVPFHIVLHALPEQASALEAQIISLGRDAPLIEL